MPSEKPAEFGKITIPGIWNDSVACAPSVFQSEYNYGNSFYSFKAGLVHFIFVKRAMCDNDHPWCSRSINILKIVC